MLNRTNVVRYSENRARLLGSLARQRLPGRTPSGVESHRKAEHVWQKQYDSATLRELQHVRKQRHSRGSCRRVLHGKQGAHRLATGWLAALCGRLRVSVSVLPILRRGAYAPRRPLMLTYIYQRLGPLRCSSIRTGWANCAIVNVRSGWASHSGCGRLGGLNPVNLPL